MDLISKTDDIIKMYTDENLTTTQIAGIIGCSSSGIGRLLIRNGITPYHTPNEIKLSAADMKKITESYAHGKTTLELADEYNVCNNTIAKIIKQQGMHIRPAKRRSIIKDHRYFNDINSPEKAYFLGWMMTDGSVIKNKSRPGRSPVISLELQSRDSYIISMFANELGALTNSVKYNKKRNHSYFRFASEDMANDLSKYSVVPNKSELKCIPHINEKYLSHYIRGVFDGDGTVTVDQNKYIKFAFFGSDTICYQIRDVLNKNISAPLNKVGKSTCYHIWFSGKRIVREFYNYIYSECGDFYLKRKREIFEQYI